MNMLGMANLNAMGITPEAQLLAAQIAAAGGGFGQPGLGLGGFGGLQGGMDLNGPRSNSGRSGERSPGVGSGPGGGKSSGVANGGVKKEEEDFDPVILSDVPGWLRTLRLHKYTPNFEGMSWKEMITMDEQALEAQGARRKMLKTFEVVRKKMGIDDPMAPRPPPSASSVLAPPNSATFASANGNGAATL